MFVGNAMNLVMLNLNVHKTKSDSRKEQGAESQCG